MQETTREQLLDCAMRHFAARGFYGASLAGIADEVGLTKQALLHHFKRKEALYAAVLSRISDRMLGCMAAADAAGEEPREQLFAVLLAVFEQSAASPHGTRIVVRELLDSERRANEVHSWYLKPFLSALVDRVRAISGLESLRRDAALARVYPVLGAMSYLLVSDVVLTQMYGAATYARLTEDFAADLRRQVERLA
ncbi:MAG: TetR/AcrR family transcriptional regulator [Pseudomonadota bacterium]